MKSKPKSDLKIALLGRNPILEDEFINEFQNWGVEGKNIISLDDQFSQIEFDIEDDEARFYLPLEKERLKDFDIVFVFGGMTESRADYFNTLEENLKICVIHSEVEKDKEILKGKSGYYYIPSPEIVIISEILQTIRKNKLKNFHWSLYESASSRGKEGLKELFNQTVDVLNFQTPEVNVFSSQIAFNIIPLKPELKKEDENEIRKKSGYEGILYRNAMYLPIFHMTYLTFFGELENWEKDSSKEIKKFFEKSQFFELKKEILSITDSEGKKPSIYIDTEKEKCFFGIVSFDAFKLTAKIALQYLEDADKE